MKPADDGHRTSSQLPRCGTRIRRKHDVCGNIVKRQFGPSLSSGCISIPTKRWPWDDSCLIRARHLFNRHRGIVSPEVVPEAEIHSYQAIFWDYVGSRENECRVAGYRHLSPMSDSSSALRGPRTNTM